MNTVLNMPIQQADMETLQSLKEKFPNAQLKVEVRSKAPNHLLTEELFWKIIDLFDWTDAEDNERVLKPALDALSKQPIHHIYLFDDMLAAKLFKLDAQIFAENIGEEAYSPDTYFSVDNFLYARCCVVANGKTFYTSILKDPTLMPKDLTFEAILSLAQKAYEQKTGKEYRYVSTIPIETYSNKVGWHK